MIERVANYILLLLENYSFFYILFRKQFRTSSIKGIIGTIGIVILLLINLIFSLYPGGSRLFFNESLLIYVLLYCLFDVSLAEMPAFSVAHWLILSVLEKTTAVILHFYSEAGTVYESLIMITLISGIWLYYGLLGRKLDSGLLQLPLKLWWFWNIMIFILAAMVEFVFYIVSRQMIKGPMAGLGRMLIVSGGVLLCSLYVAMIYIYNHIKKIRFEVKLEESQKEQQRQYSLQLIEKEEKTRQFRHEITNDMLVIHNYCACREYDKLESYLKTTFSVLERIREDTYNVGNIGLNAVLNYYLQPVRERYHVRVIGCIDENIAIDQRDLCIVSANLIKNAVEAVSQLNSGGITFDVRQGKNYIAIKVQNSFDGSFLTQEDGLPVTTKQDRTNHGIGLEYVKQITEKYAGRFSINIEDGCFVAQVFMQYDRSEVNMTVEKQKDCNSIWHVI